MQVFIVLVKNSIPKTFVKTSMTFNGSSSVLTKWLFYLFAIKLQLFEFTFGHSGRSWSIVNFLWGFINCLIVCPFKVHLNFCALLLMEASVNYHRLSLWKFSSFIYFMCFLFCFNYIDCWDFMKTGKYFVTPQNKSELLSLVIFDFWAPKLKAKVKPSRDKIKAQNWKLYLVLFFKSQMEEN